MDLLVLGVYGVFGEWLQMLPAAKRGEPPDVGSFMHRNVATVAFAEHFPLRMVGRGLRRLAMVSPSGPRSATARCRATAVALREIEHHSDVVLASGVGKFESARAGWIFWPHSHAMRVWLRGELNL